MKFNYDIKNFIDTIGPLNRTLACDDTDKAYCILKKLIPGSKIDNFKTGDKVWTWTIPPRWELKRSTIKYKDKILLDSANHHLHIQNYSKPIKDRISHDELMRHIVYDEKSPNSIPFSFDFYNLDSWGFSVQYNKLNEFIYDYYDIDINSNFIDGDFNILKSFHQGRFDSTIIICTNICHPTQVNDSISGLAVMIDVFREIIKKETKYSYLFLCVPETIGSIAYLSRNQVIIDKAVGGFFTEMLGNNNNIVLQKTRNGLSYWDKLSKVVIDCFDINYNIVDFMKSASNDEKVLDSPGVDIPSFAITRYPYPEYHSSDDNIALIDYEILSQSKEIIHSIFINAEEDFIPVLKNPGPIFLSGYDLYPDWRNDEKLIPYWNSFVDIMYSIDGKKSLIEIAFEKKINLNHIKYWMTKFLEKDLIYKKENVVKKLP